MIIGMKGGRVVKDLLLAAIFVGIILPGSASAGDTSASPQGTIVGKEGGIVTIPSKHSVDETVDRLKNILQSKQITLFALIDHSGEAAKVGMKMPPTKLLIFGNPKGGTPLMLAAPSTALDLPLKILVSEELARVQQPGVPKRAARSTVESAGEYRGHRNISGHGRRVVQADVCFWHKADMAIALQDVRFWG
jgi:uncharacterized protein (DUF302 family)